MQNISKQVFATILIVLLLGSYAQAIPSAIVLSRDTSFCENGSIQFKVKFNGLPPFGIIYTLQVEGESPIKLSKITQSDWIAVGLLNPDSTYTEAYNDQKKSFKVTINKVFDSSINMNGTAWPESSGVVIVGEEMNVRVDHTPNPLPGINTTVCGYSTQLNGKISKSTNISTWWSTTTGTFSNSTNDTTEVVVPTEGAYLFWLKEIEGTCKDSASVTTQFNGYAKAVLSGGGEICVEGKIPSTLVTTGSYPLKYWYTNGTNNTGPIIVNTTPFDSAIYAVGDKIFIIDSISDKNGCGTPLKERIGSATSIDILPQPTVGPNQTVCANNILVVANPDPKAPNGWWSGNGTFDDVTAQSTNFVSNVWGVNTITWNQVRNGCKGTASLDGEFFKQPTANAGTDQRLFLLTEASLEAEQLDYGIGTWSSKDKDIKFTAPNLYNTSAQKLKMGESILMWKVENGVCLSDSDFVTIDIKDFTYNSGFTPNGDGINDVFEIFGLIQRPVLNNELKVFDSVGRLVYSQKNYDNTWTGTDNAGKKLIDGAYYFFFSGDGIAPVKSYVIIKSE